MTKRIQRPTTRAAEWFYWKARLHEMPRVRHRARKFFPRFGISNPVIVYQMGKVGSLNVFKGLLALDLDVPVYHCHMLNHLDETEERIKQFPFPDTEVLKMLEHGRNLRRQIESDKDHRWNLVSLVRAPVPRNISAFFELITDAPDFLERWKRNEIDIPKLRDQFLNEFDHIAPKYWFDSQVKDVFGLDVYATPFPRERGYDVYETDRIRLLVMRLESLTHCLTQAMQEFLGIPDFRPGVVKTGKEKSYGDIYRSFLGEVTLPQWYVDEMNGTQYAQHFYSRDELARSALISRD